MYIIPVFEVIIALLTGFYVTSGSSRRGCITPYTKGGCWQKLGRHGGVLPDLILYKRHSIQWKNYQSWLESLVCECAAKARLEGYKVFGIQYWGECWGSKKYMADISSAITRRNNCKSGSYKTCTYAEPVCTGKVDSTFIYTFASLNPVDGGYSPWSGWTTCSKSCGNGFRTRDRSCTKPKQANGGKNCNHLGEAEELDNNCNPQTCPASLPLHTAGCTSSLHSNGYDTLNAFKPLPFGGQNFFCRAVYPTVAKSARNYIIQVKLYSVSSKSGPLDGRAGVMFNVKDDKNFQFFYLRLNPDSNHYCYLTGVLKNGVTDWRGTKNGKCPGLHFVGSRWIQVRIYVTPAGADVYADGRRLITIPMALTMKGKGGVVVRNGENNIVRFKDYTITSIQGL